MSVIMISMTQFFNKLRTRGVQVDAVFHLAGLAKEEHFSIIESTDRN